jgi:hypothetical protein
MGKPKDPAGFGRVECDDVEVWVAPTIWAKIGPQTERIQIAIEGYGRFWLYLDQAVDR